MRTIKGATGDVLMRDEDIRERWGQYFSWLMNEENPRVETEEREPNQGLTAPINEAETERALKGMKSDKAVWSRHSLQAVQQHNDHGDHAISLEGQRTSTHLQGKGRHPRVQELQRDQAPDAHIQYMGASTG